MLRIPVCIVYLVKPQKSEVLCTPPFTEHPTSSTLKEESIEKGGIHILALLIDLQIPVIKQEIYV